MDTQPTAPSPGRSGYSDSLWDRSHTAGKDAQRTDRELRSFCHLTATSVLPVSSALAGVVLSSQPVLHYKAHSALSFPKRGPWKEPCHTHHELRTGCTALLPPSPGVPQAGPALSPGPEHKVRRGQAGPHGPGGRAEQVPGSIAQVAAPRPGGPGPTAARRARLPRCRRRLVPGVPVQVREVPEPPGAGAHTGQSHGQQKAPTNILYKVDDMTAAPMDVRQWVDTDEAGGENVVVPPGTYVKVAGHLRSFQNKKSLVAFKIMPLENMNEFTTHILEIVNAHMILRKNLMSASRVPQSFSSAGISDMGGYGGGGSLPVNGLTAHQSQVLNLIKSCHVPEGMSLQDLKLQLHSMSMSTIKQAVEFLSSEGHIYSTVDDDHYKSTDAE
uniref:Replication protein A2 n=1 Tax=Serinus canaria TaxID=9135 RepID=A0A8C9NP38_SERCA